MMILPILLSLLTTPSHATLSLNGTWEIRYDPKNRGLAEQWVEKPPTGGWYEEKVPACLEAYETGATYDGVLWYRTTFTVPASWQFEHVWLGFAQVNYRTTAWLNRTRLGTHDGGYTRFRFDATAALQPGVNELLLRVVDPGAKAIDGIDLASHPHAKEDWYYNYGGVIGDVTLEGSGAIAIDDVFVAAVPDKGRADVQVRLQSGATAELIARAQLEPCDGGVAIATAETSIASTDDPITLRLPIDRAERWSIEKPQQYDVRVTIARGADVIDERVVRTGFRTFRIENNRFALNGTPILLKGILYQPYYPGTLARPPSDDWVRHDVDLALAAGFNLMRLHLRAAPRALVEYADQTGMLLFCEPPIGWLNGASSVDQLAPLCLQEVRGLIERDRNSPSVVMWGMLNEASGQAHALEDRLTAFARSLDPTRIVCDDSGGWHNGAYYMAPHSMTHIAYDDVHAYLPYAERAPARHELRHYGSAQRLLLISEYGFGGLTPLEDTVARFVDRPWLEDARQYASFLGDVRSDYDRLALGEVFPTLSAMFDAGQSVQALSARAQTEALRLNPHLAGYIFTQFQDASWECSAGIVDVWQQPKPVYQTLRDVNGDVLVLDVKQRCALAPATFAADVLLAREQPRAGKADLMVRITDSSGRVVHEDAKLAVDLGGDAITTIARNLEWSCAQPGSYRWQAQLTRGDATGSSQRLAAQQETHVVPAPGKESLAVGTIGNLQGATALLDAAQIERTADQSVVVAGDLGDLWFDEPAFGQALDLLDAARTGRNVLFLTPPADDGPLATLGLIGPMQRKSARGSFVGKFHFARGALPYFAGLPVHGFLDSAFATIDPDVCLSGFRDHGIAAGVLEAPGKYVGADLVTVRFGTGRLVFSTFRLLDASADDAMAVTLLGNLVRALAREPTADAFVLAPTPLTRTEILEQYRAARATRIPFWVSGPFASDDARSGFEQVFAPEVGAFHADATWQRAIVARTQPLDFARVLGHADRSVAYAVTFLHVPTERAAILATASDDGLKLWLNAEQVFSNRAPRTIEAGANQTDVVLRAGWNEIRAKVDNVAGAWRFNLQVLTVDGKPMKDVQFALEPRG